MRRWNARAAILTAAILGAFTAVVALLWSRPGILLWVLGGLILLLAASAIYLIIAGSKHDHEHDAHPAPKGARDDRAKTD
jgi:hypothetical protein